MNQLTWVHVQLQIIRLWLSLLLSGVNVKRKLKDIATALQR